MTSQVEPGLVLRPLAIGRRSTAAKTTTMKLVQQQDKAGCGVACVAMLAGKSYDEVRRWMFEDRPGGYTKTQQIREALCHFGVRTAPKLVPFRSLGIQDLTQDAILKVNPRPDGHWHWIVWDAQGKRKLDPRIPPYRRYKLVSYLPVIS